MGKRLDQYVVVPVTVLQILDKLTINGRVFEFRKAGDGRQVLMSCMASKARYPASWSFVFDKEVRRCFRIKEGVLTSVVWG